MIEWFLTPGTGDWAKVVGLLALAVVAGLLKRHQLDEELRAEERRSKTKINTQPVKSPETEKDT